MSVHTLPIHCREWNTNNGWLLEKTRRTLIDHLVERGFSYVHPPMFEYASSLNNKRKDAKKAFHFIDPAEGELMEIRTDISPQISRLDYVQHGKSAQVAKYCYAGQTALATVESLSARNPYQIGAEIFADERPEADEEILTLALENCFFDTNVLIDFGHSGILRKILDSLAFPESDEQELLNILRHKSVPDMRSLIDRLKINKDQQKTLHFLLEANATEAEISELEKRLLRLFPETEKHWQLLLDCYQRIRNTLKTRALIWHFDIAELRGLDYHTGLIFGLYAKRRLICRGGRYNHLPNSDYRSATGFTIDLDYLIETKMKP